MPNFDSTTWVEQNPEKDGDAMKVPCCLFIQKKKKKKEKEKKEKKKKKKRKTRLNREIVR